MVRLFTMHYVWSLWLCHLSSFGTSWSVVVQFGYWWYTWSHVCICSVCVCHKQLQNTMFVFEEESIFCESCYEKKFAKTCHSCRRPIVGVSGAAPVISCLNSFMYNMYFVLHTNRHTLLLHKDIVPIHAHCMNIPISAHSLSVSLSLCSHVSLPWT